MKIIGINGSPRQKSNSAYLLEKALASLSCDTEIVHLKDVHMERCRACNVCGKTKEDGRFIPCVMFDKDDVTPIWERIADEAAGILLATPVYFGLPTPLLVDFLNRSRYLRHQDFRACNTVFGVITVAGRRSGGAETTIFSTWYPLIRNGMLPVGNGDKSCQFGAIGWAGGEGEVSRDVWGEVQAVDLAQRVYDTAQLIEAGKKALGWKNPLRFDYPSGTFNELVAQLKPGENDTAAK